jgi:hypothetical protein
MLREYDIQRLPLNLLWLPFVHPENQQANTICANITANLAAVVGLAVHVRGVAFGDICKQAPSRGGAIAKWDRPVATCILFGPSPGLCLARDLGVGQCDNVMETFRPAILSFTCMR